MLLAIHLVMTGSFVLLVIASSEVFKEIALLWIGLVLFLVISVFGAVYVNRGCKVRP